MIKKVTDYCDISKSEQTITVNYLEDENFNEYIFIKSFHSRCPGCNFECPIFQKLPLNITKEK